MKARGRMVLAGTLLGLACGTTIPNPTGDCEAQGDGSRPGYAGPGEQWLPDCQNTLRREYWRVFAKNETSAYTLPRLDGNPLLQPACTDDQHELRGLVQRYALCAEAMSREDTDRINNMLPADALALTHFLHGRLRFKVSARPPGIDPWPIPADVVDACDLRPATNSPELTAICNRVRDTLARGLDIGSGGYTGPAGMELVGRLNELYGIN